MVRQNKSIFLRYLKQTFTEFYIKILTTNYIQFSFSAIFPIINKQERLYNIHVQPFLFI